MQFHLVINYVCVFALGTCLIKLSKVLSWVTNDLPIKQVIYRALQHIILNIKTHWICRLESQRDLTIDPSTITPKIWRGGFVISGSSFFCSTANKVLRFSLWSARVVPFISKSNGASVCHSVKNI